MSKFIALVVVLLLGFFLRVHDLNTLPPGMSPDEAHGAVEALRLVEAGSYPFFTDVDHPEPFDIVPWALGIVLFGPTGFAVRLMTVYISLLAVAATHRAGRDLLCAMGIKSQWAGIVAAAALATFAWHVALSRHLYRGVHLNLAQALFISQIALALWRGRWQNFMWAGLWLGATLYTYTAARAFVLCLPGLLFFLLLFNRQLLWRNRIGWLWLLGGFGLTLLPLLYVAVDTPAVLFTRTQDVAGGPLQISDLFFRSLTLHNLQTALALIFVRGPGNPQYNVPYEPLAGLWVAPLLALGLLIALIGFRRWQNALLLFLLPLMIAPAIFSGEMPHGLREVGLFTPVALLIGLAAAQVGEWSGRIRGSWPRTIGVGALIAAIGFTGLRTDQAYHNFWQADVDGSLWWFFAYDRVAAAEVIRANESPLYVPVQALQHPVIRYFIASKYRTVKTFNELPAPYAADQLPLGRVLIPIIPPEEPFPSSWPTAVQYALLLPADNTIYLLPRLTEVSAEWLSNELQSKATQQTSASGQLFGMGLELNDFNPFENETPMAQAAQVNFGDALTLTGWDGPRTLSPGIQEHFTLYWSAPHQPATDYFVFLQLVDDGGQKFGGDDVWALKYLFPSGLWTLNVIAPDDHSFVIPADLPPGRYWLSVGVYAPFRPLLPVVADTGESLGDRATIGPLKIPLPPITTVPSQQLAGDFGSMKLLGYDLSTQDFSPGQSVTFTFYWQASDSLTADYTAFLHVQAGEILVGQADVQPEGGRYPTSIWDVGEVITTTHTILLASDAPPGPYTAYVGWYAWPSGERLIGTLEGQPATDGRVRIGEWP